ncbi:MAG: hypothetical protein H2055_08715 [Sphingopyxis sp.]|nr:hypothetical protein [Sphingopyxis sp.]
MRKKLSFVASRDLGARLIRWSVFGLVGVTGGALLGELAAGPRLGGRTGEPSSYAHLSANPGALAARGDGADPCRDCADSYGVAIRLPAQRLDRSGQDIRELGAVDVDAPILAATDEDYRYGGRFPDPQPVIGSVGEGPQSNLSASDPAPADMTPPPLTAIY